MSTPWSLREVSLDLEIPTAPTLRLLATLRRRHLASGLIEWLAGRAELRRLAVTEHRPGIIRLLDRAGAGVPQDGLAETSRAGRGWPFGAEDRCGTTIDRHLIHWLHGHYGPGLRIATVQEGAEACVLFSGEAGSVLAERFAGRGAACASMSARERTVAFLAGGFGSGIAGRRG